MGAATRSAAVAAVVALGLGAGACGGGDGGSGGATEVDYAVSTLEPTLGQAYYTSLPQELGYWEDEGLDVEITRFNGSGELVTALAAGQITVGSGGTLSNMAAHVNGNADTRAVLSDIPGSVYYPMVPEDSPIQTLRDFEGKTLGVLSLSADGPSLLKGVLAEEGVDVGSIDFVPVGAGASVVEALRSGKIDAYQGYDAGYAIIERLGVPLRRLESPIDDLGFMSGVMARAETIEDEPEMLTKLGRGIAKAMVFAKANPEVAVRLHWQAFPEAKPAGVPEVEALEQGVEELQVRLENVFPVESEYGRVQEQTVDDLIGVAEAGSFIDESVPAQDIWTPDLLAGINDFDVAAVEQEATDYEVAQ